MEFDLDADCENLSGCVKSALASNDDWWMDWRNAKLRKNFRWGVSCANTQTWKLFNPHFRWENALLTHGTSSCVQKASSTMENFPMHVSSSRSKKGTRWTSFSCSKSSEKSIKLRPSSPITFHLLYVDSIKKMLLWKSKTSERMEKCRA